MCQSTNWHTLPHKPPIMPYIKRVKQITHQMRKIESQMCSAVQNSQDWQSANTSVHFDPESNVSIIRLYGSKIAEIGDDYLTLFDGDHQTKTTKSRLNALLSTFGYTSGQVREYIFQKNQEWFVSTFDDKFQQVVTVPFESGMVIA